MDISSSNLFHIYKTGRLTVIGFEGKHLENPLYADSVRDQLLGMIRHHDCEVLVVDLMDVGLISSWILGVLTAIKQSGTDIELYHPSKEIQHVLDVTQLSTYLHVRGSE
ncbi:STAS domain-containing protein [Thalassoglobus sp.]|uniref:STAS domain-containing protein n=1 Tax=Thalassoglobus sp. TaxID=2795869 RepID=UPI003AA8507C